MPQSILPRIARVKFFRKCFGHPFLAANEWLWNRLPDSITMARPLRAYGSFLHYLVRLRSARLQRHGTYFLRNRPELRLIRTFLDQKPHESTLNIAVLACSNGAEVYSILWTVRSARPDLKVCLHAVDISQDVVEIAQKGAYPLKGHDMVHSPIFERLSEDEMLRMFDRENGELRIKPWIKEGIDWRVGDAGDPGLVRLLGKQDIVVANNFLCHMPPQDAEKCLRNLASLVTPGGYLFVSGVDLDIRTKIAVGSGWAPIQNSLEEIHNGDPSVRGDWPWQYWGLEPFDSERQDRGIRYASVFQLNHKA